MWEGPESDLLLTENAQAAIMASSIAVLRVLQREGGLDVAKHARLVAGHSLGEYSALCAAGAFSSPIPRAFSRFVACHAGGCAGGRGRDVRAHRVRYCPCRSGVCGGGGYSARDRGPMRFVFVANDNAPGQVVISGLKATVERAGELAKAKGVKRVLALAVSAPFHCR